MRRKDWNVILVTVAAVVASAALMCVLQGRGTVRADAASAVVADPAGESFVYAFDPDTEAFPFTFALPVKDANPRDVLAIRTAERTDVWFTQMMADQLAQLVVTSTADYAVNTYTDTLLNGGRPRGIAVTGRSVYLAQTANDLITVFRPPTSWIHMPPENIALPTPLDEPYALTVDDQGEVWGVERAGNVVRRYDYGTLPDIPAHELSPGGSQPTDIAVGPDNKLWFTQHTAGQIGRLSPVDKVLHYYPLPRPGLAPTGISVDSDGHVWVVALRPHRVHLPVVIRG